MSTEYNKYNQEFNDADEVLEKLYYSHSMISDDIKCTLTIK